MTRDELSALLAALVRRGAITLAEARATLDRFDAGDLVELPVAVPAVDDNRWVLATALLLLALNGSTKRPLSTNERKRAQKLLRRQYEVKVSTLAAGVAQGGRVGDWQTGMQAAIGDYTRQMAVAGAGTLPGVATRAAVETRLSRGWPYLRGFATQIAAREIGDRPMSAAWIAQRSRLYGGSGWASFFEAQGAEALPGYVDVWVTRDDPHTCDLCFPRHQMYFLPTQWPWPGDSCRGDCRCLRIPEYLPDIYAELSGQRSTQIHPVRARELARFARTTAQEARIAAKNRGRA